MERLLPRCVESAVFVVCFFFPCMSDLGSSHMHRQCDACCQHSLRPAESALEHGMCLDACHCVFYSLSVMINPRVYGYHCSCEYLSSLQNEPGDHAIAGIVDPIAAPIFP